MLTPSDDLLRALPKAELHVHLDGSLRPETMIDLARARGVRLPAEDPATLRRHMIVSDARRLEDYLERFELTLSVMQDAEAVERVAYEVVEDHAGDTVRWLEVRFCPALSTRDGMSSQDVLDAMVRGMRSAGADYGIETGAIVCALRTADPSISLAMAELAAANADRGVVAFDLAGAEAGYPVDEHLAAFRVVHEAGVPITVHAGEGYGAPSIEQALDLAHAVRIGHGTRLGEDPRLLARVRDRGVLLEVCVTSNVQTRVAASYDTHPVRHFVDEGVPVALCTDNRLMSGVTLTDEYVAVRDHLGFTTTEVARVARAGFEHAFAPAQLREALLTGFDRDAAALA